MYVSVWFHGGILHLLMNMMAFQGMGPKLERNQFGSLQFFYLINLFALLCGVIHTFIAYIAYLNPLYDYPTFMYQCNIGFSSVLFALLTVLSYQSDGNRRLEFSMKFH